MSRPDPIRRLLIAAAVATLGLLLILPLVVVVGSALQDGWAVWKDAVTHPQARAALRLTLLATVIAVPLNAVFGVAAALLITHHRPRGRNLLISLIDLPFTVSPVVAGLMLVLIFGAQSSLGAWLIANGTPVIFAVPGIVLATVFVTFPFVARELMPLLEARGTDEEVAAVSLGARGWAVFRRVTLPGMRWGLLYGLVLCTARAVGEFGAVSVVSGHIRGRTNTLPLHVEVLFNEYQTTAAFAVASLLTLLAVMTLLVKEAVGQHVKGRK
jgi:sulfate transport system permease protein